MLEQFCQSGKIDFALGGQFGSEGKGSAAAWLATALAKEKRYYNIITVNNGAQSGHTSVHKGIKRVLFHLPTAGVFDALLYNISECRFSN
jgi:adenylosuccinate synthase